MGLRDNPLTRFLPGLPRWLPLDQIRQVGDVILVDTIDSLSENFVPERFNKVINCQVITESGDQLGRVLGFSFDIERYIFISFNPFSISVFSQLFTFFIKYLYWFSEQYPIAG